MAIKYTSVITAVPIPVIQIKVLPSDTRCSRQTWMTSQDRYRKMAAKYNDSQYIILVLSLSSCLNVELFPGGRWLNTERFIHSNISTSSKEITGNSHIVCFDPVRSA